ncbi:hypothetical protein [Paenibacillus aquistagni]|nr:hypothetical protein [Paenibacillus aquistagni]NMM51101.1 hypothetical protein [Paenibacillus aquistagni]
MSSSMQRLGRSKLGEHLLVKDSFETGRRRMGAKMNELSNRPHHLTKT